MDSSPFPTIPLLLERSSLDERWGFRLQGGADFRIPLSIKKILPNSPSHNKLYAGDGLAYIDGIDTSQMKHEDAQLLIRNALRLQLILRRGQCSIIRPTQAAVKFSPSTQQQHRPGGSSLNHTKTPNNYRRF